MRQLNLQLYARSAQKHFNEALSDRKIATLGAEPTTIELSLKTPGREKFVELRLDPDDKPSTFVLHALDVRSDDGTEAYTWSGKTDGLGTLIDLKAHEAGDQVIFESSSDDPFLLIALPKPLSGTITLSITVSQDFDASRIEGHGALGRHQQELAEAVRSLQGSLRFALDDLAAEQEGLQDALVVHHTHSRSENVALKEELSRVLSLTEALEGKIKASEASFASRLSAATEKMKSSILTEVRDDWRSLSRQIEALAERASTEASEREAALAARDEDLAKLLGTAHIHARSHEVMKQVRAELGSLRDDDALSKLKQLKADAENARGQVAEFESSFLWRLSRRLSGASPR